MTLKLANYEKSVKLPEPSQPSQLQQSGLEIAGSTSNGPLKPVTTIGGEAEPFDLVQFSRAAAEYMINNDPTLDGVMLCFVRTKGADETAAPGTIIFRDTKHLDALAVTRSIFNNCIAMAYGAANQLFDRMAEATKVKTGAGDTTSPKQGG